MPIQIIRQDITKIECDAIVNPSNCYLEPGGGADLSIHEAAGKKLYEACQKAGGCEVGRAIVTPGFDLPCKYVIHTAGPRWSVSKQKEHESLLSSCYKECLKLAKEQKCESLAIPLISTGSCGFPHEIVLKIATQVIQEFLFDNEMLVYLVVYDKRAFEITGKIFNDIQEFIDDVYVDEHTEDEVNLVRSYEKSAILPSRDEIIRHRIGVKREKRNKRGRIEMNADCSVVPPSSLTLESMLSSLDESFAITLLKLIDIKGMSDVECYKKANVSKQTWHKIMNDKNYKPSKNTVIAFAISLHLTFEETQRLLATVGFTLSRCSKFDVIIEYFINKGIYDIMKINNTLFSYDQACLGC